MHRTQQPDNGGLGCMVSRRNLLLGSSAALATMSVLIKVPGQTEAQAATVTKYPRKKIGGLSGLIADQPQSFSYPDGNMNSTCLLIKLGTVAGGGVGRGRDIVAFNAICTHQGGPLAHSYKAATKSLGACPFHLSTFDLTRYGILISGQAYQSLPQVLLEVEGDDIIAVGMMGLIYGRHDNLKS